MDNWSVYIVECADKSLYTGISNNVEKRVLAHNNKKGAVSVKGKLPVKLVYSLLVGTKSEALKKEYQIKKLSRFEKIDLVNTQKNLACQP